MSFMKVAGRQMSKGEKGGDRIEELIEDGDKALKGLPSKSSQQSGPDPKALKDAFLETSPTFQEMLQSLEEHDMTAVGGGPPPTKYDQAFFSALRTMLRECLFTKNAGLKKHHIDRVYAWYKEKLHVSEPSGNASKDSKGPTLVSSRSAIPGPRPSTAPVRAKNGPQMRFMSSTLGGGEDDARPTTAWGDMTGHANDYNENDDPDLANDRPVRPVDERIKDFKMRNLRVSQLRRQGVPADQIRAADRAAAAAREAAQEKKLSVFTMGRVGSDVTGGQKVVATDKTDRAVKELWLRKRQEEDMERRSELEVQEAMNWWAQNRARIEEEISRRQESIRYASQTARLHSRPASAYTQRGASRPVSAYTGEEARNNALRLDEELRAGDFDSDREEEEEEEGVEVIEDMLSNPPLPDKFAKVGKMQAPYDGLRASNTSAGWAMNSPNRPISARLAGKAAGGMHNFGDPDTLLRPYSPMKGRPQTAGARAEYGGLQSYEMTGELKIVKNDILLHGFSSPHTSRPPSSYRMSQATTARHSAVTTPSETPRKKAGSPGGSRPGSALSSRTSQLTEVDRIKRSFARSRIVCPLNVIERALCVPEDRTYSKCVESLPKAGGMLIPDPIIAEAKKAKAGKKGKKGKKGKGGKKKKK